MGASNNPVFIFTIVLLVILIAPIIVSRLRIPGMVGLILAGSIIGPNALGLLQRDATINLLGTIGLLFIMFIAGLEIDLNQFKKNRRHGIIFGNLTFWVPMILGIIMGRIMMGYNWPVSILLGSVFSSHTLLPFSIVSKLGLSKNISVTASIGGTLLTDIGAMMVLAVVASSSSEPIGTYFWVKLSFLVTAYFSLTLWLVPKVGRWFLRNVAENGEVEFIFVMTSLFVCSYCSILVGLEPIIGAFLAGLSLNRLIPDGSTLMNRVHFVGNALFIPFFLISTGMIIDVRILHGGEAWAVTLVMLGIIFLTKWFASWVGAKILGFTADEGMLMFGLSINQAAATLAAVIVGHRLGLFGESLLTGTIIMIAVTCLFGTWFTDIFARRVALKMDVAPDSGDIPDRVMVSLANPENAERLVDLSMFVRKKNSNESLYALSVVQDGEDSESIVSNAEKILSKASSRAIAAAIPVIPLTRLETNMAEGILYAIKDFRISVLVAGWSGKLLGLGDTFGITLDEVVTRSMQTVIIAHVKSTLTATRNMILAIPPSSEKHAGFTSAIHTIKLMASQLGTPIRIVMVSAPCRDAETLVSRTQPAVPIFFGDSISRWRDLPDKLASIATPNDFIMLINQRRGEFLWHPFMNRLPGLIADSFPNSNFAVIYPPLSKNTGIPQGEAESHPLVRSYIFTARRIRLDFDQMNMADSVHELIKDDFANDAAEYNEIVSQVNKMLGYAPLELGNDIILFHTYVPTLTSATVFVGVNHAGYEHADKRSRIMILLISPTGVNPESHLKTLSSIAASMKGDALSVLLSATSPEEAVEWLNNNPIR